MDLTLKVRRRQDGVIVATVTGSLTALAFGPLRQHLTAVTGRGLPVVVDLAGARQVGTSALALLGALRRRGRQRGVPVTITRLTADQLAEPWDAVLLPRLDVYDAVESAAAAIARPVRPAAPAAGAGERLAWLRRRPANPGALPRPRGNA